MVNGKKLLASVLVGAMVITGSPVVPAWSVASVEAAETAKAIIYTATDKFEFTLSGSTSLADVIDDAKDGDTVEVTGTYKILNEESIAVKQDITIDLSKATIENSKNIVPYKDSSVEYCANEISPGRTQYAKKVYTKDNLLISFPETYGGTQANNYGVTAAYVMSNGITEATTVKKVTSNSTVTCTKAGKATVTATVDDGKVTTTKVKEYKDQPAMGHNYGADAKTGIVTAVYNNKVEDDYTSNSNYVTVKWSNRGGVFAKDENGNTKVESVTTTCANEGNSEKATSVVIKSSKVKTPATTNKVGTTTYTLEVVTADGVTITVNADCKDIPTLEANKVGKIISIGFLGYNYTKSGDTYVKNDTPVYNNKISFDDEQEVDSYYKTEMAENGDITYEITYSDAVNPEKEGTITGTLSLMTDDNHKAVVNTCGRNTYYYPTISVQTSNAAGTETKVVKIGTVEGATDTAVKDGTGTNVFKVKTAGYHTVDMNDGNCLIKEEDKATTIAPGKAKITCKYCGDEVENAVVPVLTTGVIYEDKEGNETDVDDIANAQVFTRKATCTTDGFDYYWVIGGDKNIDTTPGVTHNKNGVIRKIDGTETKATGHNLGFVNSDSSVKWVEKEGKQTCKITYSCYNDKKESIAITYHEAKGTDNKDNKYSAITSTVVKGADCTKKDVKVFTVTDVKDAVGKVVDYSVPLDTYGPHNYTDVLTWADNCKSATVTRKCSRTGCEQNTTPLTVAAKVVGVDNTDGTTTYTASLDDKVLGTKTIYDLTKAEVIVNDGKAIDKGAYADVKNDTATVADERIEALKDAVKKAVVVKINGAVIDSKLYEVVDVALKKDGGVSNDFNDVNNAVVTVSKAETAKDVIGTKTGNVKIEKLNSFDNVTVKLDGKTNEAIDYDGKAHALVVSVPVEDATVKYMVSKKADLVADEIVYDADKAEVTDVGTYYVYYQISKDTYTTKTDCETVTINKVTTNATISVDKATILYGESFTATTGDKDLDAKIGLKTVDTSKKSVGVYKLDKLVEYNTNYDVTVEDLDITIKARNATIVLKDSTKVYDGKAVEPEFDVKGVLDGDDLNIQLSTVGGKEIKNAGTYQVIATANNANYVVEKTTATVVIEKKPVTITLPNVSNTTTALPSGYKATVDGVLDGDDLNVKPVLAGTAIKATYDDNANYEVTVNPGTLTIEAVEPVEPEPTDINLYAPIWADDNRVDGIVTYFTYGADPTDAVLYTNVNGKKVKLEKDVDYTIEIDSKNAGTREVTVKGIGKYTGSEVYPVVIEKKAVTITLPSVSNTTNALPSGYKATVVGVVAGDNLNVKPVLAGTAIKATYDDNANYDVKVVEGKLTVVKPAPKAQSITTTKLTANYKVAAVKKAAKTFSIGAKCTSKAAVTAKKVSGSKKITVSSTGKVKIAKGTKKGTYTAQVKLFAGATSSYKAATKTVKVTVKVK